MYAAGRSDGGGLDRALGGTQCSRDVKRAFERTELARLEWKLVQGSGGHARGGGGIIGGSIGGRIMGGVGR
jgi:hypothetical protein